VAKSRPTADSEADVLREALRLIRDRLPSDWVVKEDTSVAAGGGRGPDALIRVGSARGDEVTFVAEVKRTVLPRDLAHLVAQLRAYGVATSQRLMPLVVARYLAPSTRDWLVDQNVAYADATGNIRISVDRPPLFLRDVGASTDPWRGPGRPRGTLVGEPPARVVRALVDYEPPVSVPRLVELSGASTGATYRVVQFLEEQALIRRAPRGPIEEVRWRQLLERWANDYGFLRSNSARSYLQPRGIPSLTRDLAGLQNLRYAVTGSFAAQKWAPYAPVRAAMIYAEDADRLANELGLRDVDTGGNVLVATAAFDVVFERAETFNEVTIVAPSQAVVDMLTGPGRNPAEAQALIEWMESNVQQWRR